VRFLRSIVWIFLVSLTLSGCDDTFLDPFENDQRYFTVYGFLDPLQIRQSVRIIPVTRFPEDIRGPAEGQAFIDARVYTRDLTDSTSTLWTHELKKLGDGSYIHLYHADFLVKPGHTYRLDVIRNDEKRSTATTTVPKPASDKFVLASGPVVRGDSTVIQEISLPGISALWDLNAVYLVQGPDYIDRTFVPYKTPSGPGLDGLWKYQLNITADQDSIIARAQRFMSNGAIDTLPVTLTSLGVQFRIIDSAWHPLLIEEDVVKLSQPGIASNVINGYGIFGSMGLHREEWEISAQVAKVLGYPISVDVDAGF
jgi:hypothetical protein